MPEFMSMNGGVSIEATDTKQGTPEQEFGSFLEEFGLTTSGSTDGQGVTPAQTPAQPAAQNPEQPVINIQPNAGAQTEILSSIGITLPENPLPKEPADPATPVEPAKPNDTAQPTVTPGQSQEPALTAWETE